ncbi:hypothetical protein F5888DRAFT_1881728 [Russula emetica]|nr:hypothetical protein F5888DRAFT_1881728 [Russula emetica]
MPAGGAQKEKKLQSVAIGLGTAGVLLALGPKGVNFQSEVWGGGGGGWFCKEYKLYINYSKGTCMQSAPNTMDICKNDVHASFIQSYKYAHDLAKMLKMEITCRVIKEEKKDIKKKNICNIFSEDTTLNGSTNGYNFIRVYTLASGVLDGSQPKTVLTVSTRQWHGSHDP